MAVYQSFPMLSGRDAQAWRHQPAYRRPRHFHDEPELNVVFHGQCTMNVGDHRVHLGPGDVLFLQPGQDHALAEHSEDLNLFVFAITPRLAELANVAAPRRISAHHLNGAERQRLSELLTASNSLNDASAASTLLTDCFSSLAREFQSAHVLCRRAIEGLREDMAQSIEDVAHRLNVHPTDVGRFFCRDMGLKLVTYRARMRLIDFIHRVDAGETMTTAAVLAGFGSYSQCHRVFRTVFDCSPKDYFSGQRRCVDARVA